MMEFKKVAMIIDDDADFAHAMSDVLEINGITSHIASTGDEANGLLKEFPEIGVVLSDIKLENEDGTDVLHHLKNVRPDLPVIMITAYADLDSAINSVKFDAYDYLKKPCDPDHLISVVNSALGLTEKYVAKQKWDKSLVTEMQAIREMGLAS